MLDMYERGIGCHLCNQHVERHLATVGLLNPESRAPRNTAYVNRASGQSSFHHQLGIRRLRFIS